MGVSDVVALYLFLGGAAAGLFIAAAAIDFYCLNVQAAVRAGVAARCRYLGKVKTRGYVACLIMLAVGSLCLLSDLGRPKNALLIFMFPTVSYLSVGAYALVLLAFCAFAVLVVERVAGGSSATALKKALLVPGCAFSLVVMAYTGFLLRSLRPIALWDSCFLPLLFVVSSCAAGLGCIALCFGFADYGQTLFKAFGRLFARIDLCLILLEVVAVSLLLVTASSNNATGLNSVFALVDGNLSALFWGGFVCLGIAMPLVFDIASLKGFGREWTTCASSVSLLVGCFCLRLCLVQAGIHVTI